MSFRQYYQDQLKAREFSSDQYQEEAVEQFQRIDLALRTRKPVAKSISWFSRKPARPEPVQGFYLWGGVGRGKTWMMDLFYDYLHTPRKQRLHFHRFMKSVHERLGQIKGQKNPLEMISQDMAADWDVLCLDEFTVVDIGDAVILAGLLRGLIENGVVLVTTSNVEPQNLYKDGIQRASFLPAIELLRTHTNVLALGGDQDYRQEVLEQKKIYHTPLGADAEAVMRDEFQCLANTEIRQQGELLINHRAMPFRYASDGMVWFDFEALCGPPRSQHDYIELAKSHHTIFMSDIPVMGASRDDRTRRFIFLIDEFYDRHVKLVLSAEAPLDRLYIGERLAFEFQRTQSRLTEMQTAAFLASPHLS